MCSPFRKPVGPLVPETVVVFRKWKDGDVIALFPEVPADRAGILCLSYERVGQHGGADYQGVVHETKPATEAEYQALAEELKRAGYNLRPVKRASRKHYETLLAEARRQ